MKKQTRNLLAITLLVTCMIFSCKKKEGTMPDASSKSTANTTTTGGTTGGNGSFMWQENSGAVMNADSAYWTTGTWGTGVRAYKGGMANFFEINWLGQNATSVGSQTLDPTYGITFIKNSTTYNAATGQSLSITAGNTTNISGFFSSPVTGGTITTITGTFTSLSKK